MVHGERRKVSHADGVAVRFGLGNRLGADIATGPCFVVNSDGLPEHLAHEFANLP